MFDTKKIAVYLVVLILIPVFIIVYIFTSNNDGNDREGIKTDHAVTQNDLNISQNKNLELQNEEKNLIEAIRHANLRARQRVLAAAL